MQQLYREVHDAVFTQALYQSTGCSSDGEAAAGKAEDAMSSRF
jgi:hypothetical protein